jgi:hypothetical protein
LIVVHMSHSLMFLSKLSTFSIHVSDYFTSAFVEIAFVEIDYLLNYEHNLQDGSSHLIPAHIHLLKYFHYYVQ